jgi:hypothetical protein
MVPTFANHQYDVCRLHIQPSLAGLDFRYNAMVPTFANHQHDVCRLHIQPSLAGLSLVG